MNFKELDSSLSEIVSLRTKLSKMSYNDETYDEVEDQLHDLEDDFIENFGEPLEEVVSDILTKLKSDSDVLLPTAYLPQMLEGEGKNLELGDEPGVTIDIDDFGNQGVDIRLVLIPQPSRFVLMVNQSIVKEMWKA